MDDDDDDDDSGWSSAEDTSGAAMELVPKSFLCPISQEVMADPFSTDGMHSIG